MAFDCMEDCIHLKACRRIQAIGRKHRLMVPRYCTEDCTAYVSGDVAYLSAQDACEIAWRQYDGRSDERDVYAPDDFSIKTLGEIVNELQGDE